MGVISGITRAAHALIDHTGITGVGGGGGGAANLTDVVDGVEFNTGQFVWSDDHASYVYLGSAGDGFELSSTDSDGFVTTTGTGKRVWISADSGLVIPYINHDPSVADQEGAIYFNAFSKRARVFRMDGIIGKWHDLGPNGSAAQAYPINYVPSGTYTTAITLVANGGTIAIPFVLPGAMHVHAIEFYNTDSSLTREWELGLFLDTGMDEMADLIPLANDFGGGGTVGSAGIRSVVLGNPPYAPGGIVWLLIRNIDASNTLGIGSLPAAGTFQYNSHQTKTLTSFLGDADQLDLVTGWSKATGIPGAVLRGRVFAQSGSY